MARILIDLKELATWPLKELDVVKALVKLHAGQSMQQVRDDLSLDDSIAKRIASFLVSEGGRQRLPLLFCDRIDSSLDEMVVGITRHMNQVLGTRYSTEEVRKYVVVWYKAGFTEMIAFTDVVDDRSKAWRDDRKLKTHLRPQTLFGEKFEQYRNLSLISSETPDKTDRRNEFTGI